MSTVAAGPRFLGDEFGTAGFPDPPVGFGALACLFSFTSSIRVMRADKVDKVLVNEPNRTIWVPPPEVLIDGRTVRASWSSWWYPLRPGPHDIEVTGPAPATLRVSVTVGVTEPLRYAAEIYLRRARHARTFEPWQGEATLTRTDPSG